MFSMENFSLEEGHAAPADLRWLDDLCSSNCVDSSSRVCSQCKCNSCSCGPPFVAPLSEESSLGDEWADLSPGPQSPGFTVVSPLGLSSSSLASAPAPPLVSPVSQPPSDLFAAPRGMAPSGFQPSLVPPQLGSRIAPVRLFSDWERVCFANIFTPPPVSLEDGERASLDHRFWASQAVATSPKPRSRSRSPSAHSPRTASEHTCVVPSPDRDLTPLPDNFDPELLAVLAQFDCSLAWFEEHRVFSIQQFADGWDLDEIPSVLMAVHEHASEMLNRQARLTASALLLAERLPKVVSPETISAHVHEVQAISDAAPAAKRQALIREVLLLPVEDVAAPVPTEDFSAVEHSLATRRADALIELLLANISHSSRQEHYASCKTDALRASCVSLVRDKLLSFGPNSLRACLNSLARWEQ